MTPSRRHVLAAAAATLFTALHAAPAVASDAWPTRPIRFVVPFGPGGANDLLARAAAEGASKTLGQPIIVVDRAMKDPATVARLQGMGIEPVGGTRASFIKFVDEERARLGGVVKATGMKDE